MPDNSPMPAVRVKTEVTSDVTLSGVLATEMIITPTTEIAIATSVPRLAASPRKTSANSAACAGSVRE